MATPTTKELKILITIANQAKNGFESFLSDLADMQQQVEALTAGLENMGKGAEGLEDIGKAAEETSSKIEATTEATHKHGEEAKPEESGSHEGGHGGGHGGGGGEPPAHGGPTPTPPDPGHGPAAHAAGEHADAVHKLTEAYEGLLKVISFISGGFLAIEAIHLAKELLDVAARTETLGVVLNVVGKTAGYSASQLRETDEAVQKLGITAESSRESLTELIKAGIDLSLAKPLARASQDLAVVAGQNSSETFKRLITNIDQMDTLGLRFMGVMINKEQVMAKAAADAGTAISGTAQKQVFANAVLNESAKLAGVYEASMNTVGKMLTSFPRYVEEFKDAVGALGQGLYVELVKGATEVVKSLTELAKALKDTEPNADVFGESVAQAGESMGPLATAIRGISESIVTFNKFLAEHAQAIKIVGRIIGDIVVSIGAALVVMAAMWADSQLVVLFGIVVDALLALVGMITGAAVAVGGFGATFLALTGPVGWFIGAVIAIGLAVWGVVEAIEHFGKSGKDVYKENNKLTNEYLENLKKIDALLDKQDKVLKAKSKANNIAVGSADPEERRKAAEEAKKLQEENEGVLGADGKRHGGIQSEITELAEKNTKIKEDINKNGKLDPVDGEQIRLGDEHSANLRKLKADREKLEKDLTEDLPKVGSDIGKFQTGISQKFNDVVKVVKEARQGLYLEGTQIPKAISEITTALVKASETVSNDSELAAYEKEESDTLLEHRKNVTAEEFERLRIASSNRIVLARQTVEEATKAEEAGSPKILAILRKRAIQESQFRVNALQRDIERRKVLFDIDASNERFSLEHGLSSLKEYLASRRKAIDDALNQQRGLSNEHLASLQVEYDNTPVTNQEGRAKVREEMRAERDRLNQAELKSQTDRAKLVEESYNTQVQAEQSIAQMRNDLNNRYGHEEVTIQNEVEETYRKQLQTMGALATEQDKALARDQRDLNLKERMGQLEVDRRKKELDNERAYIDLLDQQASSSQQDGTSTGSEVQDLINENIQRRISLLDDERTSVLKLRDTYAAAGETAKALEKNTQAIELTKQMYSLRDSVKSLGAELQTTFSDSLASNLEALLEGTKKFKDAFLDIFKDLNKQILKSLTKDMADNFVKSLKGDGKGGDVFSQFGELLTGKSQSKPEVPKDGENQLWAKGIEAFKQAIPPKFITSAQNSLTELQKISKNTEAMAKKLGEGDKPEKSSEQKQQERQESINSSITPYDTKTANAVLGHPEYGRVKDGAGLANSPIFDQAAKAYNLDKYGLNGDFLRYVATKESQLNPDIINKDSGASGLMQLMPETAKGLGLPLVDILDPFKNVMAGAKLLAQLLERYNGDLNKALSAYNSNPTATDKAIKAGKPYSQNNQTKDYVAKLGSDSKLFTKANPLPVQVVTVTGSKAEAAKLRTEVGQEPGIATVSVVGSKAEAEKLKAEDLAAKQTDKLTQSIAKAAEQTETNATQQTEVIKDSKLVTDSDTEATKEATSTTQQDTLTVKTSTLVMSSFDSAVQAATAHLNELAVAQPKPAGGKGGEGKAGPVAPGTESDNADITGKNTSSEPDSNADITQVNGLTPPDAKSGKSAELISFYSNMFSNMATVAVSSAVGKAVSSSMGHYKASDPNEDPGLAKARAQEAEKSAQGWGSFASLVTNVLTSKVANSLKEGFQKTAETSASDIRNMGDEVDGSMSSFFTSFGKMLMNFFSSLSGGGGGMGGGGGFLSSLFGGGGASISAGAGSAGELMTAADFGSEAIPELPMLMTIIAAADGGYISGPGTSKSDSIPARLSHGEYVMTADKTEKYLPLLEAMRSGTLDDTFGSLFSGINVHVPTTPMYANGGYVSESAVGGGISNNNRPVTVHMQIVTPDSNSFRKSKDQLAAQMGQAANRAIRRNT